MLKCWDGNLYSRPPFSKVVELIISILESRERLAFSPTSVLDFLASDDGNSESSSENGDLGPEIITNPDAVEGSTPHSLSPLGNILDEAFEPRSSSPSVPDSRLHPDVITNPDAEEGSKGSTPRCLSPLGNILDEKFKLHSSSPPVPDSRLHPDVITNPDAEEGSKGSTPRGLSPLGNILDEAFEPHSPSPSVPKSGLHPDVISNPDGGEGSKASTRHSLISPLESILDEMFELHSPSPSALKDRLGPDITNPDVQESSKGSIPQGLGSLENFLDEMFELRSPSPSVNIPKYRSDANIIENHAEEGSKSSTPRTLSPESILDETFVEHSSSPSVPKCTSGPPNVEEGSKVSTKMDVHHTPSPSVTRRRADWASTLGYSFSTSSGDLDGTAL